MREISFDFETRLISAEHPAPKPVCLSWAEGDQSGIVVGMAEMETFLTKIMWAANTQLIAHNLKFEMLCIHEWFPALRERIWELYKTRHLTCTMVNEKVIANFANKKKQRRFDLAYLVKKYMKIDISAGKTEPDAWRLRYSELESIPLADWPQEAIDYSISDSVYTLKIYEHHRAHSIDLSYKSTRADFVLGLSANRGMEIDSDRVCVLEEEILTKLQPEYEYLEERGMGFLCPVSKKFKKNSKTFREYIEDNVEFVFTTPKGNTRVGKEYLDKYVQKEGACEHFNEILASFVRLGTYDKILTAFVPHLKSVHNSKNIMRTNYNPVVDTGRTSSMGSKLYPSVNIQQMPKSVPGVTYDVRNCYKARKGYKLVSIDYGGLELCTAGNQLKSVYSTSRLVDYVNEGDFPADLHSRFAARVMSAELGRNVSYEDFMANKKTPDCKAMRLKIKAPHLGVPGGIGVPKIGGLMSKGGIEISQISLKDVEGKLIKAFSENQANYYVRLGRQTTPNLRYQRIAPKVWTFLIDEVVGIKNELFKMYPRLQEFLTEGHLAFLTGEYKWKPDDFGVLKKEPLYAFNAFGIKRNFMTYTQFCNSFLMQSPSAQGAKQMLWDVGYAIRDNQHIKLNAFIHDEIIIEVRDNELFEESVDMIAKIMIGSMQKVLPAVRINVEASAMKYWSKDGDGSFDKLYWMDVGSNKLLSS